MNLVPEHDVGMYMVNLLHLTKWGDLGMVKRGNRHKSHDSFSSNIFEDINVRSEMR